MGRANKFVVKFYMGFIVYCRSSRERKFSSRGKKFQFISRQTCVPGLNLKGKNFELCRKKNKQKNLPTPSCHHKFFSLFSSHDFEIAACKCSHKRYSQNSTIQYFIHSRTRNSRTIDFFSLSVLKTASHTHPKCFMIY